MKRKSNKLLLILITTVLSVIVLFGGVVTYAYFASIGYVVTEDGEKQIARIGMGISLLFDRLDPDMVNNTITILTEANKAEVKFDPAAEWGSKENPYIISDIRHLQNLSILQNIGYFKDLFIDRNYDENDQFDPSKKEMPYFLVCEPDGTPATINGKDITFASIGSDEFPFIGYVGGAFAEGTTDVGGNTSGVSTLSNIQIVTTEDQPDVGLFGHIGYLGTEPEDAAVTTFQGQVSTVRDLVLSDVTVKVQNPTWEQALTKGLHKFTFDDVSDADSDKVPHENHHIGILAGHVEYAQVEFISVYYSSDDQIAIDLRHTANSTNGDVANYLSISGIIGFVYNMNPEITEEGIGVGSGTNNSELEISTGGAGSGGGLASGTGRGYVTAEGIYENYKPASTDVGSQTVYMFYDANAKPNSGILLQKKDGKYTLEDGTTPVTFSGDGENKTAKFTDSTGTEYQTGNYFVKVITKDADEKEIVQHYLKDETTPVTKFQATDMLLIGAVDANGNALCTRYYRKRLIPFFPDEETDNYYFYDGVFTFALSSTSDHIASTWINDTPDSFVLGGTTDADWTANTAKGNKAVAGYVKQITNNGELDAAIQANKQLFIMADLGGEQIFVMTLYEESAAGSGAPDTKFSTSGLQLEFNDQLAESLVASYQGGDLGLPEDITADYNDVQKLVDAIENKELKVINLGVASAEYSIDEIKERFNIRAGAVGSYTYTYENGVLANPAGDTLQETYDFGGYFYYTKIYRGSGWEFLNEYRDYFYVDAAGQEHELQKKGTTNVDNFFGTSVSQTQGEYLYSHAVDGQTVQAVVINLENTTFHGTNTKATLNGGNASKPVGEQLSFFVKDPSGKYFYQNTEVTIDESTPAGTTSQGKNLYSDGTHTGILLYRYPEYTLSNGSNSLRLMSLNYSNYGTYYSIWNGTDSVASTGNHFSHTFTLFSQTPTVTNEKNATIVFQNDNSCYIEYFIDSTQRYVAFDNNLFKGATVNTNAKLYIYSVEGTQDIDYGRITFDPKTPDDNLTFKADEFILWPNSTMAGSNVAKMSEDPSYTIKQLEASVGENNTTLRVPDADILKQQDGWKNHNGEMLTMADLHKKFSLGAGIAGTDYTVSAFGGSLSIGENGMIVAPVGTLGVEADIPIGCVAFRINKTGTSKIRVIVAVPQTELYYTEEGNPLIYDEDYYFALWNVTAAGDSFFTSFSLDNAKEVFELPRSNPYKPGTTPGGTDNAAANVSKYINVTHNGASYRCYLNGNRVLVGYEFTVEDEGVYIMGCTKPMEIVYFSADGTASAGRDGSSGSRLGTIDFVYDHDSKIVPVTEASGDTGATEDYSKYYASLTILQTKNGYGGVGNYPNINDLQILIRRSAQTGVGSSITYQVKSTAVDDCKLAEVFRYSTSADEVVRKEDAAR